MSKFSIIVSQILAVIKVGNFDSTKLKENVSTERFFPFIIYKMVNKNTDPNGVIFNRR